MAQKKNGSAVINQTSLKHFDGSHPNPTSHPAKRSPSPSKVSVSSGSKSKGKASAHNSGEEDDDDDSGDEAEKLNDEQMNELDTIYRK